MAAAIVKVYMTKTTMQQNMGVRARERVGGKGLGPYVILTRVPKPTIPPNLKKKPKKTSSEKC